VASYYPDGFTRTEVALDRSALDRVWAELEAQDSEELDRLFGERYCSCGAVLSAGQSCFHNVSWR
jgi:hypothetical protein